MRRLVLSTWLALACASCSSPKQSPDESLDVLCDSSLAAPASAPALEILGEHGDALLPIVANDNLDRIHGPQGGQHFYLHVRVFTDSRTRYVVSASLQSSTAASLAAGTAKFSTCSGQWSE